MNITITELTMVVTKTEGDIRFRNESHFLYHVKRILNEERGYDLIKKRMHKDGHLVDDLMQYLRARSPKSKGPHACIWNRQYAIYDAGQEFNKHGLVSLAVMNNIFLENPVEESCK